MLMKYTPNMKIYGNISRKEFKVKEFLILKQLDTQAVKSFWTLNTHLFFLLHTLDQKKEKKDRNQADGTKPCIYTSC